MNGWRRPGGWLCLALLLALPAWAAPRLPARTLQVGPQRLYQLPSQAARQARDGDVIEIDAGEYRGDAAIWRANNLTIRGAGGMAVLRAAGASAEDKAIWVIKGHNTTVERVGFLEAQVRDRNGAGIRLEGRNLTVRHCLFRDNENGILTGANAESELLVEHSEFEHNGHGDGQSHNLYVGALRKFTLRFSHSHRARIGHQVKSRAAENHILYNRLADDGSGRSSYLIDLPAGGLAYVAGNVLHQGPLAENYTMVSFGAEQLIHPANRLHLLHNTLVNDRSQGCRLLFVAAAAQKALVLNNLFSGCSRMDGPVLESGNAQAARNRLLSPEFRAQGAPAGLACSRLEQLGLSCPEAQYAHPMRQQARPQSPTPAAGAHSG